MPERSPACFMTSEHLWASTDDPADIEKLRIGAGLGDDVTIVSVDVCRRCGRIGPGLRTTADPSPVSHVPRRPEL